MQRAGNIQYELLSLSSSLYNLKLFALKWSEIRLVMQNRRIGRWSGCPMLFLLLVWTLKHLGCVLLSAKSESRFYRKQSHFPRKFEFHIWMDPLHGLLVSRHEKWQFRLWSIWVHTWANVSYFSVHGARRCAPPQRRQFIFLNKNTLIRVEGRSKSRTKTLHREQQQVALNALKSLPEPLI